MNVKIIVLVFDNITLVSKDNSAIASTVQDLQQHFKLHNLESIQARSKSSYNIAFSKPLY